MNSTDSLLSANDSTSEETNVWNSTGTTDRSSTYGSSDIDWSTYLLSVVQWIIFFVGAVGNIIVLVVLLWRRSRSQVSTQLFVGSLAVADIGLMFSTVWVEAYDELQETWHFGVIPCKLQYMWQWLTMNCSIWTLAALSIDRYLQFCEVFNYLTIKILFKYKGRHLKTIVKYYLKCEYLNSIRILILCI